MNNFFLVALCVCSAIWTSTQPVFAQMTFSDLQSYCRAIREASTPTLLARTQNIPRAEAESLMQGLTDPAAIRLIKEIISFAYSRPAGSSVEVLRSELRDQCLAKKIFVQ